MVHVQGPRFFRRQVLVKVCPGSITVPGGTFTSAINSARSHAEGSTVGRTGVGVLSLFRTVSDVLADGICASTLSPPDTRASHPRLVCPTSSPLMLKVNTAPLVVALLPLLPATATMKLPPCGPLIATTGSAPKRSPTVILLSSAILAVKLQVNSALVYPPAGTLCRLTVTSALSSIWIVCESTTVETYGPTRVGVAVPTSVGEGVIEGVPEVGV